VSGKVPPSSRARGRKPLSRDAAIRRAASLYERFTGHKVEPDECGVVNVPDQPKVGVLIGDLDFVGYTTVRDGVREKYIHKFAAKDRPSLVVAPDGKSIHVVGGRYTFTERGIVDHSDPSRKRR
jgi:hypothetical protein